MPKFCPFNCEYLSYTEEEQRRFKQATGIDRHHRCKRYGKRLFHRHYHPELVRLRECIDDEVIVDEG